MRRIALAALLMSATLPAMAQEKPAPPSPRTIDMTVVLHQPDGKPINGPDGKPETIGNLISQVLMQLPDKQATIQQLMERAELAKRIESNPKAVLTAAETTLIEKLVIEGFGTPLIVSQIIPLIDPAAGQKK